MSNVDDLKKAYFSGENKFLDKPKKFYGSNMRNITAIFGAIADMPEYQEVRKRYRVHNALGKILLTHHLGYIVFATYRGKKLIIMATNHIAQQELNYQKMKLIQYLKYIDEFKEINEVSILRWDKELRDQEIPEFTLAGFEEEQSEPSKFEEKSYSIFENQLTDKKLKKLVEEIREIIKVNKEST